MPSIKPLLFIYLSLSFFSKSSGQSTPATTDSLHTILSSGKTVREKVNASFFLGEYYWFERQLDSAIVFLHKNIKLENTNSETTHSCNARLLLGHVYMTMENFDSSFYYFNSCLTCSQNNKQSEHIPKAYEGLSMLYHLLGDNEKAITNGLEAATLYEKNPDPKIQSLSIYAWLGVGRIMGSQGEFSRANGYFQKALKSAELLRNDGYIIPCLISLAANSSAAGDFIRSKEFYTQAYLRSKKSNTSEMRVEAGKGLGNIAMQEDKFYYAINYYKDAVAVCRHKNLMIKLDELYGKLGNAFMLNNQLDSAQFYLGLATACLSKPGQFILKREIYNYLSAFAIRKGDKEGAIDFLQKEQLINDSLYSLEKYQITSRLEILYQTAKKEQAIEVLHSENDEKKNALIRRNRTIFIISVAALVVLLLLILLYRNSLQKKMLAIKETQLRDEEVKFLQGQQHVIALQSMVNGQEAERTRIAKDLHDGLGGLFSTIKMYFSTLKHEEESLAENNLFGKSYELINTASEEVRRIAHNMMPEVLIRLGLIPALQDMCNNISAGKLLHVKLQVYGVYNRMNASTEIMLYRIIQELLNNIIKHAQASEAIVQFNLDGNRLMVTVEDNGRGFDMLETDNDKHSGLETIRSRVSYLNGNLSIDSQKTVGTTITMEFLINKN